MTLFTSPELNLKKLGITDSMHVADLGAGSGHYTKMLSSMVPQGKVYALEVQKEVLERLRNDLKSAHITNVECLWVNIEKSSGTKLGDAVIDACVVSNVLFQIEDKMTFVKEIRRILKPNGKVLVVDWAGSFGSMGPQSDAVVTKDIAKKLFENVGFTKMYDIEVGANHWGMIVE